MSGFTPGVGTNSGILQDGSFPVGTVMVFNQTTPPVGWAKGSTTDVALRVTNGTVGTGGSVAFETAFAAQTVPVHTLTKGEIPAHAHRMAHGPGAGVSDNHVISTDNGHDQSDFQSPIFEGDSTITNLIFLVAIFFNLRPCGLSLPNFNFHICKIYHSLLPNMMTCV